MTTFTELGPMPKQAHMRTVDERVVRAPPSVIFDIAADVERWPEWLPHYRWVRFVERNAAGGIVEMAAHRRFGPVPWPTWWMSIMHVRGGDRRTIRFRHIRGITTGMEVEWSFAPVDSGEPWTRATILHLWDGPRWPIIGTLAARAVIGPVFVHGIASRTLAGLARAAELRLTSA